jgi:uncharacterized membrane protein YccC
MIVFGFAEIITSFTHDFFGLHTARGAVSAGIGAAIGASYATSGFLILTMRRRAAAWGVGLLIIVVAGRISMVATGLYPVDGFRQLLAIILGTSIAAGFAIYVASKWSVFR